MKNAVPMQAHHVPDILRIEQSAYSHPWTHGNFIDSIASGYHMPVWFEAEEMAAYLVAMRGVDEVHLLNFTVAPVFQRQGRARVMLQYLRDWSIERGAHHLWLEVRASNLRAIEVYHAHGFKQEAIRRAYYPLHMGQREDAVVMSLEC
jgi:ribosomal-protein-alanine N-acetyltransferase